MSTMAEYKKLINPEIQRCPDLKHRAIGQDRGHVGPIHNGRFF